MRETADLWAYEREAREQGYTAVCGVDEAGAGPLMGPVYAAAVILPEDYAVSLDKRAGHRLVRCMGGGIGDRCD